MKRLLYIGLWLVSMELHAQFDALTIKFSPSFMRSSTLTIEKEDNAYSVSIKTYDLEETSILSDSSFVTLRDFLNEYRFEHKYSIRERQDTVIVKGDTVINKGLIVGEDGIYVYGKLTENGETKKFEFWSPEKGDLDHKLVEILFNIMYSHFKSEEFVNYLEELAIYFDFKSQESNNDPDSPKRDNKRHLSIPLIIIIILKLFQTFASVPKS